MGKGQKQQHARYEKSILYSKPLLLNKPPPFSTASNIQKLYFILRSCDKYSIQIDDVLNEKNSIVDRDVSLSSSTLTGYGHHFSRPPIHSNIGAERSSKPWNLHAGMDLKLNKIETAKTKASMDRRCRSRFHVIHQSKCALRFCSCLNYLALEPDLSRYVDKRFLLFPLLVSCIS